MFEFDIAISFAGEDRKIAYAFAKELHAVYNLKVFYDDYEQAKLLGKNLTEYLIEIYKNKARYCIILVSKYFKEKRWTRHEWRAAQARAFQEPDVDYILPIQIDDIELPGLLPTVVYMSLKKYSVKKITRIIYDKVKSEIELLNTIRVAEECYNNSDFERALELVLDERFDKNLEALRVRALSFGKHHNYQEAIRNFRKITESLPDDFQANLQLGIYYYRISDFENSVKYYELAANLYPNHPTIQSDLPIARKKRDEKGLR